jgi:hypothetical protein
VIRAVLAVVLLDHVAWQPPMRRESETTLLSPQTYLAAPLAAGR